MVSLVTEPIPEQYLYRLTFWSRKSTKVRLELDKSADVVLLKTKPIMVIAGMASESEDLPWWRKIFNFLCGIESASNLHNVEQSGGEGTKAEKTKTKEELAREAAEFLHEEPWWHTFVNVNAVILMAVTIFFIGFYA